MAQIQAIEENTLTYYKGIARLLDGRFIETDEIAWFITERRSLYRFNGVVRTATRPETLGGLTDPILETFLSKRLPFFWADFPDGGTPGLGDYLNSLKRVSELEVDLVLPGHEHLFTDLKRRVAQITRHHEKRNSTILKALDTRPRSAYQIARKVVWGGAASAEDWNRLGSWDRRMAVLESLAHLEAMRAVGRVSRVIESDMIYYLRGST